MKIIDLIEVSDYDVVKWLEKSIPNLTVYQKEKIRDNEIVRFAPFYFMKRGKKVNNVWLRFSIIFILPVICLMTIGLPFNFFITGRWGYRKNKWLSNWISSCGL